MHAQLAVNQNGIQIHAYIHTVFRYYDTYIQPTVNQNGIKDMVEIPFFVNKFLVEYWHKVEAESKLLNWVRGNLNS